MNKNLFCSRREQTDRTRTVDVHVRYLRQKIEDNPDTPQLLQTVRGVGYKFVGE